MGMDGSGRSRSDRSVAVVGASCRLPGGIDDLDALWQALREGRDLVTEVPADRFDALRFVDPSMPRPGKSYTGAGGFLTDIRGFDADYFGIAPKEAARMDPQQRLLLELAAEACDDAGISPQELAGSDTAVLVGIADHSYGALQMLLTESVNAYTMSGAASSVAANRVSHFLDLRGPSLAVDTACSSSLVALVQACRTLLAGESRAALVGGVNLLLSPYHYVGFCQASMLSPTGRCRSFSAGADGYVRAEGGGMVLLKRLAEAVADGDRIRAVIVDGASNSDGRTAGLALPRKESQESLLRQVYDRAGIDPDDIAYLEAHGTGTPVGDPVECEAIGRALGIRRTREPLPIGSVKSNLGHLEPASGIAGLLKALLVLQHGTIPPTLHATPPNPHVDFAALRLAPAVECRATAAGEQAVVGVNSFGFGGTNAHVVLAAPPPAPAVAAPDGTRPFVVSAASRQALAETARRTAGRLKAAGPGEFYDLAWTACRRRGRRAHAAAVLAADPADAAAQLSRLADTLAPPAAEEEHQERKGERDEDTGTADSPAVADHVAHGRIVFAFSGNGAQWAGMGADLLASDPVFAEAVESADKALFPHTGWSVASALADPDLASRLSDTAVAQPLLFAVQVAVVEVLRQRGVRPAAVVGHSVGEVAAAYTAGALTLEQAARVIAARGRAQAATAGTGRMAAVSLSREEAEKALEGRPRLEIACVNTPRDVTVSGPAGRLAELRSDLAREGVACRLLDVDHAFHSPAMDPVKQPLKAALDGLSPAPVRIPMVSTVTAAFVKGTELGSPYWWRNVRRPVLFAHAVQYLLGKGHDVFVDIGPHPILRPYLRRLTEKHNTPVAVVPTLAKDTNGPAALERTVATLAAAGARIDWDVHFPVPGRVTGLPAYPWQRTEHWNGSPGAWPGTGAGPVDHPLLGDRMPLHEPAWQGPVEPVLVPWLADHRVGGSVVLPATGYAEMALAAGRRVLDGPAELRYLEILRVLPVPWENPANVRLCLTLSPDDGEVRISGTAGRTGEPSLHARGRVRRLLRPRPAPLDVAAVRERCGTETDPQELYATVAAAGLDYGPAFRPLRMLHTGDGEVLAAYRHDAPSDAYEVHPALLDGALQAGLPLMADALKRHLAHLPGALDAVRIWQVPPAEGLYHLRERGRTHTEACWDITVTDADGTVMAEVEGCRLRRFAGLRGTPLTRHTVVMQARPRPDVPAARSPLPAPSAVLAAAGPRIAELRAAWRPLRYERVRLRSKECLALATAEVFAGALPDAAEPFTPDDVLAGGSAKPHHRRLAELVLPLLERHALAHREADGRWRLAACTATVEDLVQRLARDFPAFATEITLGAYCAQRLKGVLRGDDEPLEFLAQGGAELTEQFFDIAPWSRFHNRLMQALVSAMTEQWPADRPLRILEIGAGTGGTTAALLPLLPPERTRYVFTDISPLFIGRAEKRFSGHGFVEYRTFDLDRPSAEQGLTDGGFDLIVAANALHAAKDLALALRRLNGLLAPCGQLLALELHDPEALALSFGTLESFWSHTDRELRPGAPLLSARRWPELLEECGFTGVVRTGDERRAAGSDGSVLLAAAPERPVPQAPLPAADGTDGTTAWIVAAESADSGPLPGAVARALDSAGGGVRCAAAAADTPEQWEELIPRDADAVAVVLVLDPADSGRTPDGLLDLTTRRAAVLRDLAVACDRLPGRVRPALWLVAGPSGALPAPERAAVPEDAAAWGVTRTLANEHPRLTVRRLSLDRTADDPDGDARRVARELLDPSDEDEIALTARGRFVPRTTDVTAAPQGTADSRDVPAFALEVRDPGLAYRLAWTETDPPPEPGPGEVVLAVHAAALNYRDVMQAAGVLPPVEAAQRLPRQPGPGMECAGTVTAVGPGVTSVAAGDRVFGLAPGTFASHTVTTEHALGRMPAGMTFPEAATLPVVLLTVHYALGHLARLSEGETVLVHGGAGGVGLAALQFARRRGAHVIATAGTEAKRSLLRMLGVGRVLDSRSLDFAERIRELTAGRGVDVVLNSLAGEAVERGLEALRPGGRFVELGKRDIHEDKPLRLRPFTRNIAFFGVDLSELLHDPEPARRQFAEVVALVRRGRYRPLLHTVHPAARVTEAFRLMQHSRHVGKVVVAFDPLDEPLTVERALCTPEFDPRGTYLVTGGLGGFGAATARWLGARGARRLALVGRRGPESPEAADLVEELAARGVETKVYAADVCDAAAMRRIVQEADTDGHPLRGVVHSAMHLDDALLNRLTDERFRSVLAAKLGGGAVLDAVTRGRSLDLFLVYSSLVASLGHIAQAPYVAGNLCLEALARRRRQEGLPALAVAWGALGETGYVARNRLQDTMTQLGMEPVMPHEAFEALEESLTAQHDVAGCGRYNWAALGGLLACVTAPRLAGLVPALDGQAAPSRQDTLRKLSGMPPEQAEQFIADSLARKLAEVAQLLLEQIDHRRRIDTYGVDSLMATEVLTSLRQQYDIDIPPMELLRSEGTITDIARIIRLRLGLGTTGEATAQALPPAQQPGPTEGAVP
ncbi:SDR family NAD(P)-dependent oxidoreductase [Streptomyces morookaense]|uniref:SDR family NAD(P)-dependent oxidoreductase n=1 Tax=Streptomyces morookaense TaxID=1970 RepID=UPI00340842FD